MTTRTEEASLSGRRKRHMAFIQTHFHVEIPFAIRNKRLFKSLLLCRFIDFRCTAILLSESTCSLETARKLSSNRVVNVEKRFLKIRQLKSTSFDFRLSLCRLPILRVDLSLFIFNQFVRFICRVRQSRQKINMYNYIYISEYE